MPTRHPLSDHELDVLFRDGDAQSFLTIYDHYAPLLLRYAASRLKDMDDAADLVHDVFLKAWTGRRHIRSVKPYLYTLLRHRLIDHVRRNISREAYADMLRNLAGEPSFAMEEELEAKELRQVVNQAIGRLPRRTQEIYRLRRDRHLSVRQIALQLNISEQTVKNQLSNAHNLLRKMMARFQLVLLLELLAGRHFPGNIF